MSEDFSRYDRDLARSWGNVPPQMGTFDLKEIEGSTSLKKLSGRFMNESLVWIDEAPADIPFVFTVHMMGCQPPHIAQAGESVRRIKDIELGEPND